VLGHHAVECFGDDAEGFGGVGGVAGYVVEAEVIWVWAGEGGSALRCWLVGPCRGISGSGVVWCGSVPVLCPARGRGWTRWIHRGVLLALRGVERGSNRDHWWGWDLDRLV
jgi:hypothetical protein